MTRRRLRLPPHENAETHRLVMARIRSMTRAEKVQSLVDAGILTKKGNLTKPYRTEPLISYRDPLYPDGYPPPSARRRRANGKRPKAAASTAR